MVGVGDIASCTQRLSYGTARLVDSVLRADSIAKVENAVFTLGDNAYSSGSTAQFNQCFTPSWGDPQKGIIKSLHPAPGNHEYQTLNADPYYKYFGLAAGEIGRGYYSYDVGAWHVVVVNSEIIVNASFTDSARQGQMDWVEKDLEAHKKLCTVAYWHQPTFSATTSASDAPDPSAPGAGGQEGGVADAWWQLLYRSHATLILNGHEHVYARFRPMDPAGKYDPHHGITQLTVGTGGEDLDALATTATGYSNPNVVTGQDQAFGVLNLQLGSNGYSFSYRPTLPGPGADSSALNYSDSGSGGCRG